MTDHPNRAHFQKGFHIFAQAISRYPNLIPKVCWSTYRIDLDGLPDPEIVSWREALENGVQRLHHVGFPALKLACINTRYMYVSWPSVLPRYHAAIRMMLENVRNRGLGQWGRLNWYPKERRTIDLSRLCVGEREEVKRELWNAVDRLRREELRDLKAHDEGDVDEEYRLHWAVQPRKRAEYRQIVTRTLRALRNGSFVPRDEGDRVWEPRDVAAQTPGGRER